VSSGRGRVGVVTATCQDYWGLDSVDSEPRVHPALPECSPSRCWFQMVAGAAAIETRG